LGGFDAATQFVRLVVTTPHVGIDLLLMRQAVGNTAYTSASFKVLYDCTIDSGVAPC
jgi:hypothetical protein